MSNAQPGKCPKCGAVLDKDAPHGLCPRCLGALNFETQTEVSSGAPEGASALSLAEVSVFFPQLEILQFLGRGGMGAVYKARQKQLDRIVALKILPPGIGRDPAFAERFVREAKALARLSHPGVVTLFEFGQAHTTGPEHPEGLFYFLMEYVDGVNLRELLRAGRVSPREALAIVPQICDALQYAHDEGFVHRDIKPENILIDRKGHVKVADFGIARLIRSTNEPARTGLRGEPGLTEAGKTVGTPTYMAPEQRENPQQVDHRADIYALGVVFYEMLTGELPGDKLVPPSQRVRVDVRLDEIVLHALEKTPARRYQHASDVKTAVDSVTGTPPVMAQIAPPSIHVPAQPTARTGQGWNLAGYAVAAAIGLFILLVLFAIGSFVAALIFTEIKRSSSKGIISGEEATVASVPLAPQRGEPAWEQYPDAPIRGRSSASAVWTGSEMIVFGGEGMNISFGDGARFDLANRAWSVLAPEGAVPSARTSFTSVWAGNQMIVWGGFGGSYGQNIIHNDGGRYNPATQSWLPISMKNPPAPRFNHVAVWTGKQMIVWGGYQDTHSWYAGGRSRAHLNSGGRYNPQQDEWTNVSIEGAPSPRFNHVAVWTGKEMIVWGGGNASQGLNDGALYNPETDSWRPTTGNNAPTPRCLPVAVWTGEEMIVWGGGDRNSSECFPSGGRYNPRTDTWQPISTRNAPRPGLFSSAVWTGRYMLVWGGVNDARSTGTGDPNRYLGTGGLYDPQSDTWTAMPTAGAPSPRLTTAVWTGDSLLIFGGYNGTHLNDIYGFRIGTR